MLSCNLDRASSRYGFISNFCTPLKKCMYPIMNQFTQQTILSIMRKHFQMNVLCRSPFVPFIPPLPPKKHNSTLFFHCAHTEHSLHFAHTLHTTCLLAATKYFIFGATKSTITFFISFLLIYNLHLHDSMTLLLLLN